MKQIVILSGKGGTGKTTVAAAFAHLASCAFPPMRAVLADADVDASNLELVLDPKPIEEANFIGGSIAVIDGDLCQACGRCAQVCRFEAVSPGDTGAYVIDPTACEGCAACVYQCPEAAIHMEARLAGRRFRSQTRFGPLFHAALLPAQENSGKLVTLVKQLARLQAIDAGSDIVIVDGPPGIGCPVISAVSGADLVLIVAEPTIAGIHDMARVAETAAHFRVPALACINKADIYPEGVEQIGAYCKEHQIEVMGCVPFDTAVTQAMVQGEPVTKHSPDSPASVAITAIWQSVAERIRASEGPEVAEPVQ